MQNLLLLHGALGAASQLETLKNELSGSFRVLCFNFEGHGGRVSAHPFSMERFAENVRDFLADNEVASCAVFGYSMGGYVALTLAASDPHRFSHIVTLGTKFDWSPESAAREVAMLNPEKIEAKIPHFAQTLARLHAPLDWKENMRLTADMMLRLGDDPVLRPDVLQNIRIPVTLLLGEADKMVTIEETQGVQKLLPQGKFNIVPNWPHPIDQVNVVELAEVLRGIL